jgi:hypothetical protein
MNTPVPQIDVVELIRILDSMERNVAALRRLVEGQCQDGKEAISAEEFKRETEVFPSRDPRFPQPAQFKGKGVDAPPQTP